MSTQADRAPALGMPPNAVEAGVRGDDTETSFLPPLPGASILRIRLYDVCPDGTRHTDDGLRAIEQSYL